VKLLSMLGGFFGWPGVILIIVIASIVGSVVGIATMTIMKRRHPQTPGGPEGDEEITLAGHYLPFGPYLCFAGVIVMLFGAEIYEAYIAFITVSPV